MKKNFLIIMLITALITFNSCGEKAGNEKQKNKEKTEEPDEVPETTIETEEPEVQCEGPMMDFMAMIQGSYKDVEAALDKYVAQGIDRVDMDIYDLQEPKVVSCTKSETNECCTMEAKAGITIRTYEICWEGDKIISIADKGMR